MLRCILVCPDRELACQLISALDLTGKASVDKVVYDYPFNSAHRAGD
jgi:hypothetical protein